MNTSTLATTAPTKKKKSSKTDIRQTSFLEPNSVSLEDLTPEDISKYEQIIDRVIRKKFRFGMTQFMVTSKEIEIASQELDIRLKNPGDPIYTYRFRKDLPQWFRDTETEKDKDGNKLEWMILLAGDGEYLFIMGRNRIIKPSLTLEPIRVREVKSCITIKPTDEQSKLAWIRRNFILEHFLGLEETEAVQNHKRTKVDGIGQIEIDEIREGVDAQGNHYFIPIQAKNGEKDRLASVQVLTDIAYHERQHANLEILPVAVKFIRNKFTGAEIIACFLFKKAEDGFLDVVKEAHYSIVSDTKKEATDDLMELFGGRADNPKRITLA